MCKLLQLRLFLSRTFTYSLCISFFHLSYTLSLSITLFKGDGGAVFANCDICEIL